MDFILPLITQCSNFAGKRVILRLDLNAPIEDGRVRDDFRLRAALPTLHYLIDHGAHILVLSHHSDDKQSLAPIAERLNIYIPCEFVADVFVEKPEAFFSTHGYGKVLVTENIRFHPEEMADDMVFAERLAAYGDIYVNDAFSASHRAHASIVSIPKFLPGYAGFQLEEEVKRLSEAFHPPHPFIFILGGAKFSTKIPLIERYVTSADTIFIGGALASPLLAARGHEIGASLTEDVEKLPGVSAIVHNPKIMLPTDVTVKTPDGSSAIRTLAEVLPTDNIRDAGPQTVEVLHKLINTAAFVLWNGPLGDYEHGFDKETVEMINVITQSKAESIIGGGDTVALVEKMKKEKEFSFVSTAGGAMLDFLSSGTLPGITALQQSKR